MNEQRLGRLLREAPIPGEAEARERGLRLARAALADRGARRPAGTSPRRLALALLGALLAAALLLSPAGAAVRDWIGDALSPGVERAEPALARVPGGGRLLVQSARGPWVVGPDGGRRLLGPYRTATWSSHGLFVAVAQGRTLSAVEPGGTPHWSLTAPGPVADPRWSVSGFQIAYRAGSQLRAVGADGQGERRLDLSVAPVAAAWSPSGAPALAYADRGAQLRFVDALDGSRLASAPALGGIEDLQWAGGTLMEASSRAIRTRPAAVLKAPAEPRLGRPRRLALPRGARLAEAALSPDGRTVAALLSLPGGSARRSEVVLYGPPGTPPTRLFGAAGRLAGVAWSPDGSRLLVAWPDADQWLFLPTGARGRPRAVEGIARAFSPGATGPVSFPRVEGWCCPAGRR